MNSEICDKGENTIIRIFIPMFSLHNPRKEDPLMTKEYLDLKMDFMFKQLLDNQAENTLLSLFSMTSWAEKDKSE